jgi:hypothetical protein
MKAPNQEQREAMIRLRLSKDGVMFDTYLTEALAEASTRVALSDDPARTRLTQGEVRTLLELQKLLNPVSNIPTR